MKRYRVREGSILDYARMAVVSAMIWAVLIAVTLTEYPL